MLVAASVTSVAQRPQPEPGGQFVMVNGHRLWYRSVGQGTPLLLIPGGPGMSHTYFYPSFERFADKFRVIYFDAFGRGKSDRARTPAEYSFQHDVDDVEGLRKALGLDRIAVYGHSYGGIVAQGYALKYPQSLSKLVLADTLYSAEMWQKGNNDTSNVEIQNQLPDVWADIQQLRAKGLKSCDEAYLKVTARVPMALFYFYNPGNATGLNFDLNNDVYCQIAGRDADFMLGGDMASIDFRPRLRDVRTPTLVLAGRFDRVSIPRYSVQYRSLMPAAEFVMFEQSGHMPFVEERAKHDSILRAFLAK